MADNPKQIRVPPITWRRVRFAALDLGISAAEFVRRAIVRSLKDYDKRKTSETVSASH
jgi:hypothetical protein